jgi:hypothetical protein
MNMSGIFPFGLLRPLWYSFIQFQMYHFREKREGVCEPITAGLPRLADEHIFVALSPVKMLT